MVLFRKLDLALALLGATSVATAQTFDYIVVGGGTAGNALAVRLAEASLNVALVEAGDYYQNSWPLAAIPGADVIPVGSDPNADAPADWGFVTTPQTGANNRRIHFARGKCFGGSSAFNFMIYQRPTKESMDRWAQTVDDSSYTFDKVLPFYKRSSRITAPNTVSRLENATVQYNATAFDKPGGPVQVSYSDFAMPFSTWMQLGMDSIGIPEAEDFNSGELQGYQYCSSTIRPSDQSRSSSQTSYLDSTNATTLTIFGQSLAKKIIFDEQKNAVGVQITNQFGIPSELRASREVILSAGVFQSPQLLMVSGVGPAAELGRHGIEVVADLPGVGQNMWDHPFFAPSYRVNIETFTRLANNIGYLAARSTEYVTAHTGPLTNPVADFIAWEKIPASLRAAFSPATSQSLGRFTSDWPEAEYISGAGYVGNFSSLLNNQPKDGYQYAAILGVLITTTSRGNVSLVSADTSDLPAINPNWLSTRADQELAIVMFKRIRQAFASEPMRPIIIGDEYDPGNAVTSDSQILNWIRNNIMTLWHPACTCKMGASRDPFAVVNSRAHVYGVNRLRVVDASAFPFLPPGHPQSTVYMLAEKIADQIIRGH